ncbi:MAG: hypothetical protein WBI05_09775 [Rhodoferax sp.]|uniref:hypothetical protein n=1 Tax=Rhodoferax sp. TaxID=50421 RepID=UPI003C791567
MLKAHTPHEIANIGSFGHAMLTWLAVPSGALDSSALSKPTIERVFCMFTSIAAKPQAATQTCRTSQRKASATEKISA